MSLSGTSSARSTCSSAPTSRTTHGLKWDSSASGHVDPGESYHDCAVREMWEEIWVEPKGEIVRIAGSTRARRPISSSSRFPRRSERPHPHPRQGSRQRPLVRTGVHRGMDRQAPAGFRDRVHHVFPGMAKREVRWAYGIRGTRGSKPQDFRVFRAFPRRPILQPAIPNSAKSLRITVRSAS